MKVKVNLDINNLIVGYFAVLSEKPYKAVGDNFLKENSIEIDIPSVDLIHIGYSKVANGVFVENLEEYTKYQEKGEITNSYKIEMQEIKSWFNTYYTIHEQKFNRLISLGNDYKKELNELYLLAEEKRTRYNELEILVGD